MWMHSRCAGFEPEDAAVRGSVGYVLAAFTGSWALINSRQTSVALLFDSLYEWMRRTAWHI